MNSKIWRKTTLEQGLRVITIPQKNTQAVTILVLVGTGSKYEKKELNGISHFLEHMFFKGTKKRPSTTKIAETLDRVGGIYNAFTSEEYTGYFAKTDSRHWELALEWVADIFFNSLLPAKEVERERAVIIEEINMYQDHPMDYIGILWPKLLYGNQPSGWPIAGTKETVSKISREQLISYMKSQYSAQNTIVCLAGKIKEKTAVGKVKKYFSKIKDSQQLKKPRVLEKQREPQALVEDRKTDQTHICLGVRAFNIFHPQKYALEILAVILGGMMSSRLFIKVRGRLGLAYYINTSVSADTDTGFLVTQAGLHNNKVEKGISTILREYKEISQKKVPLSELQKAKDFVKGKMALLLETSEQQASFFGAQELLKKEILSPEQIYKKIDKISQDDILKVAKDIFTPERLNLALIGPFEDKDKFEKILTNYEQ
jgi:predicted Zn-dependent peptidase